MNSWDDAENGTSLWTGLLFAAGTGATCMYLIDPVRGSRRRGLLRGKTARVPDEVLTERVRAKLGRWVSHPRVVDGYAINGRVTLRGKVLKREVKGLLKAISKVPGVQGVDNQLDVHEYAGNVPSLQGGRRRSPWSPTTRTMVGLLGGALAAYGATRRSVSGGLLAATGAGLALRAATNLDTKRFVVIGAVRPASIVDRRSAGVDRPASIGNRQSSVE
jgi:hypothetical protein